MTWLSLKNNARTTLSAALAASATTATVADASALPATAPFLITIWDGAAYPDPGNDPGMEIVNVTAVNGNDLTIQRAQEETTDVAHDAGETAANLLTAETIQQIRDAIDQEPKQITFTLAAVQGAQATVRAGCAGVIESAMIMGDTSGSAVVDIWKSTYESYPPSVSDSITGNAKPTLSSQTKNMDDSLTGWTKSFSEGDWLTGNVDSAATLGKIIVVLTYTSGD